MTKIFDMYGKISSNLSCSGPAVGVVAGSKLPSYCIMSKTLAVAKRIESLGEGMRIHISEVRNCNKELLNHSIFSRTANSYWIRLEALDVTSTALWN